MSSGQALRAAMVPMAARTRAYFAPVERSTGAVTVFDPGKHRRFALEAPPAPWVDLGWIANFRRYAKTAVEAERTGWQEARAAQFRRQADAGVEFDFREWGKLQMALAGGAQHMNVLAAEDSAEAKPGGGTPITAVTVQGGSTANEIVVGASGVGMFAAGDMVAVDADYQQQAGYVGAGIAAAYVKDTTAVGQDVNYVRRVTFNVGRVASKSSTSLMMAQPLLGGAPPAGAGVQRVVALMDREGGSFFQEWSALFAMEEQSGGRVCFYYPRLSPAGKEQGETALEVAGAVTSYALHASFVALPYQDSSDGETALCYRSYFPASAAAVY
jgi:hypothetical protein